MTAVYLTPRSGYCTPLRSDTLWGMLLVALRTLYSEQKVLQILRACEHGEPPFIISSAFPFALQNGVRTHYFPTPMFRLKHDSIKRVMSASERQMVMESMTTAKKFKKEKFIPENIFQQLVMGERSAKEYFEQFIVEQKEKKNKNTIPSDKQKQDEKEKQLYKRAQTDVLHVSIDRLTGTTALDENGKGQLFYTHEYFVRNGGIYFLVQGDVELILPALRFLQHFGFGGDNSIGKGVFTVEVGEFSLKIPENPTHHIVLSLYSPTKDELTVYRSSEQYVGYDIEIRRGKIGTHFYNTGKYNKNAVAQFTEGSLFPFIKKEYLGTMHTVYEDASINVRHNGFAFAVPYLMKEE